MVKPKYANILKAAMKPRPNTPRRRAALARDAKVAAKKMLREEVRDLACRASDMQLLRIHAALAVAAQIAKDEIENG